MVVAAAARPARRMECAGRCIKLLLVSLSLVVLLRSPGAEAVMGDLASLQQEAALSACCPAASAWVAPANSTTADGGALLADVIALTHDETASGTSLEGHVVVVCDGGCHGTLRRNCWQQQVYPPSVRGSPLTDCPRGFALFAFPSPVSSALCYRDALSISRYLAHGYLLACHTGAIVFAPPLCVYVCVCSLCLSRALRLSFLSTPSSLS